MATEHPEFNLSTLSLSSSESQNEDWDRSLIIEPQCSQASTSSPSDSVSGSSTQQNTQTHTMTPRNSVVFPTDMDATPGRRTTQDAEVGGQGRGSGGCEPRGKRSLSELMQLHAEKGTDCKFSHEEASRVAEVLGQWINASSSPYEAEDDFFSRTRDDLSISSRGHSRPRRQPSRMDLGGTGANGRPRGQSESAANPSSSS